MHERWTVGRWELLLRQSSLSIPLVVTWIRSNPYRRIDSKSMRTCYK